MFFVQCFNQRRFFSFFFLIGKTTLREGYEELNCVEPKLTATNTGNKFQGSILVLPKEKTLKEILKIYFASSTCFLFCFLFFVFPYFSLYFIRFEQVLVSGLEPKTCANVKKNSCSNYL